MAYGLHIEREKLIELNEWQLAAQSIANLRLDESDNVSSNPRTGEVIRVPGQAGAVAIQINGEWSKVFRWHKGKVSFNAPASTSGEDPVMAAALQLAKILSAKIRGDEGEGYDGSL
ncbi:hypothetical protein [Dyella sp. S184]|uniref:hypothetical protein n=1 Tax=Dyella sp. S184 TaxID=1641862 RepID=UPI00131CE9C0|nr:hypothetical protein [Dyella sp. S184]